MVRCESGRQGLQCRNAMGQQRECLLNSIQVGLIQGYAWGISKACTLNRDDRLVVTMQANMTAQTLLYNLIRRTTQHPYRHHTTITTKVTVL